MTATAFPQVGPYAIDKLIGHGGMASVFLARDTRSGEPVALKLVARGTDAESIDILEAEQRGADLQARFSHVSQFVPKVYESGFADDHFFIAMEYIAGEDLSQAIHAGPMAPERATAIAIQLCQFLEDADRFEAVADSRKVLLHNDLKPRNVRVMAGDRIKVLDFGAAKALSLSRKVTRNDFGSMAYLSPECLDTGERDLNSDAWAVGIVLYEMVQGRQPFVAENTRRLEQRIRSRSAPAPLDRSCPLPLQAVIAKLLAPFPEARYGTPKAIREDLERVLAGESTIAMREGWPASTVDEPATRRTRPPVEDAPTRRTTVAAPTPVDTTAVMPPVAAAPASPAGVAPVPAARRFPRLRYVLVVALLVFLGNEGCVATEARRLSIRVPMQEFGGLTNAWTEYDALARRSYLGRASVHDLEQALTRQTLVLAERVMSNYLTPAPTVRENQWKASRDALRRAVDVAPRDRQLRAALRYCEGHLHRIDGEAKRSRRQLTQARQEFTEAVTKFREAASLRSGWPDPFLGLARTFIYGLEDVDLGAEALNQAQKLGYTLGERETAQLADGYRARGESLARTAEDLKGMPQERDYLERAAKAYQSALERYGQIAGLPNVAASIRITQARLERVERRLAEMIPVEVGPPWE